MGGKQKCKGLSESKGGAGVFWCFFAVKGGGGGDVVSLKIENSYLGNLAVLMGWKNMS